MLPFLLFAESLFKQQIRTVRDFIASKIVSVFTIFIYLYIFFTIYFLNSTTFRFLRRMKKRDEHSQKRKMSLRSYYILSNKNFLMEQFDYGGVLYSRSEETSAV